MPRTVYVAARAPRSGKTVVALGLVELLAARVERVGVFRPVVAEGAPDALSELAVARGHRAASAAAEAEARTLGGAELDKRVIEAYRELADGCDAVVVEGVEGDLDLDARLANHLGAPVLAVVRGDTAREALDAVRRDMAALEEKGCDVLGAMASRVPVAEARSLAGLLAAESVSPPVYVLPEDDELARPTVGEVAAALGARADAESDLDREVRDVTIAASGAEHFLDEMADGTLVIVPGDRADILLAALAGPVPAGVVLTSGLEPGEHVAALLERAPFPVLRTGERTDAVAGTVRGVRPRLTGTHLRKVATALGVFQSAVDGLELEDRMAVERPARMTPAMFEYELFERAKERRQHVVLAEGDDDRVLTAADILLRRRAVDLTILGDPDAIRARAGELGADLREARLVDPAASKRLDAFAERYFELRKHKGITEEAARDVAADPSYYATLMVDSGDADGMVSGAVHTTADTIRPAFEVIKARAGVSVVSSVFLMCLADRVLVYGDCAVNPEPTAEQLADIAISSAETATAFGVEPRVAMLSYSTGSSGKGAAVDATREATRLAREARPHMKIEGPIQYDAAIDDAVAALKLPDSEVAGKATVFVFPDLATGNIAYKAVQRSAGAVAIGPVLQGLNKPVNDLSRGCLVADIVNTVLITAIQAQEASGASTARRRVALPA